MQRALPTAPLDLCLRCTSLTQRGVGRDGDEGVQLGIELFNAAKTCFRQLHGRDLLAVHQLRCFGESERRETCIVRQPVQLCLRLGRRRMRFAESGSPPLRPKLFHKPPARQMRNSHAALPCAKPGLMGPPHGVPRTTRPTSPNLGSQLRSPQSTRARRRIAFRPSLPPRQALS